MTENQGQIVEMDELMALRTLLGLKPRTDAGVRAQILQLKKGEITIEQAGFEIIAARRREEYRLTDKNVAKFWGELVEWVKKKAPKQSPF